MRLDGSVLGMYVVVLRAAIIKWLQTVP